MTVIDELLLQCFREKPLCEHCRRYSRVALQPHHLRCRGFGAGKRLDVAHNLIALCECCHRLAHDGKITPRELWQIVADREGLSRAEIEENLDLILRTPKEEGMERCAVDGCPILVAPRLWLCNRHWAKVPCQLRPGLHTAFEQWTQEQIGREELEDIRRPVLDLVNRSVQGGAA